MIPSSARVDFCRELRNILSTSVSLLGSICFLFFPTRAHIYLLVSGGAIPVSRYGSSTLVGLRHPVFDLQTSFSSGSSLEACGDLAQDGNTYSTA